MEQLFNALIQKLETKPLHISNMNHRFERNTRVDPASL